MYCKKCGKVIPDDSLFCQYCGEQLSDTKPIIKRERKGLVSFFQTLSRGWQICIMSYICWVFLWIILCLTEAIYDEDQAVCFIVFVFILPVLALFIWYYITHLRQGSNNKKTHDATLSTKGCISSNEQINKDYSISPLLLFANTFGKMQVRVERGENGITSSYCTFTSPESIVTFVNFSESTSKMTASDITQNKDRLYVVHIPELGYKLIKL